MKRRLWMIMLALCMILTAAGTALTAPAPAAAYELEYEELSDGTLEITGCTGEAAGELRLPSTIDGKSVTKIGDCAFRNCNGFTGSLVIPDSVTEIGDHAFYDCSGFTSLTIGNSVTEIGDYAFYCCDGFTGSLTIGNSVTEIGKGAFNGCSGFTSLTIGSSVTEIGDCAFPWCSGLTSIEVAADNPNYCSIDGILYSKDGKRLIQCPGGKTGKLTIPDSVTEIGDNAFCCYSGLTGSLVLPDSVTEIGNFAFEGCEGFTGSLVIPDSVTVIGDYAFGDCGFTSLVLPDSVTQIGWGAFFSCEGLTDVYYSGTEEEWKAISIGDYNEPLLDAKIHYNSRGPDSETVEQDTANQDKPAQPQHAPQTGDSGNILLWVLLGVLSLGGGVLAFILFKRRRA